MVAEGVERADLCERRQLVAADAAAEISASTEPYRGRVVVQDAIGRRIWPD